MSDEPTHQPNKARNVVEERLFRYLLDLEVEKAVRLQYCVSLVCLTPDLQEEDPQLARHIAGSAVGYLRGTDLVTTLSQSAVGLLLVDADTRALPGILDRTAHALEQGAPRFARGERRVSVSAGGSCYPETATSAADLLQQATDLMARAKEEGGDRLYLPTVPPT